MVTIATFDEPSRARHLRDRLQQSGVQADMLSEGQLQRVAAHAKRQANMRVLVDEKDFEKAQNLLVEWEASDPELSAAMIRCPQCRSPRVEYPQMTRKFLTPALVGILCALKIIPSEFYCQDCHFTWTNEEVIPRYRFWHRFFSGPQKQT